MRMKLLPFFIPLLPGLWFGYLQGIAGVETYGRTFDECYWLLNDLYLDHQQAERELRRAVTWH